MTDPAMEADHELFDPEVTDQYVEAQVARQRWFWVLLLKDGPRDDFEDAEAAALQAAHLRHIFTLRKRGQLSLVGPVREARP